MIAGNIKTKLNYTFKVDNRNTRTTPLAFIILGSIRHHSISSSFKTMCFGKGTRCPRKSFKK